MARDAAEAILIYFMSGKDICQLVKNAFQPITLK